MIPTDLPKKPKLDWTRAHKILDALETGQTSVDFGGHKYDVSDLRKLIEDGMRGLL